MTGTTRSTWVAWLGIGMLLPLLASLVPDPAKARVAQAANADDLLVVDCLLPGQVRQLGRFRSYVTARRPIKTSASDCAIRGGEYVAYDRASYATALKVWLPPAQAGDAEAQTYVGEIYEKGLGLPPDYDAAAQWYRRAAEAGHSRAQIDLGHLYELGLGVPKDPTQALAWYRKASGLNAPLALDSGELQAQRAEIQSLRREVKQSHREAEFLRRRLEQTKRQMEGARRELKQREQDVKSERKAVDELRGALAKQRPGGDAQRQRLAGELVERERELSRREEELAHLRREISRVKQEAAVYQQQLASAHSDRDTVRALQGQLSTLREQLAAGQHSAPPATKAAGPSIEIIDPVIVATRGMPEIKLRSAVQVRQIVGRVSAPAGLLSLTVNDQPSKASAQGVFNAQVPMAPGPTSVRVVAVDKLGRPASVEFTLVPAERAVFSKLREAVMAQSPISVPNINFGTYYALIIGNNHYQKLPALDTAKNDARAVDALLRKRYGFKTKVLIDGTRYQILSALNELRKTLTRKDNLLIYYAGHGDLDKVNLRGQWLPVDAEPDSSANWISNTAITDIVNAMEARQVLIVADSCYSGSLTRSALTRLEAGMTTAERTDWLREMARKRSRTALTSGGLQPVLDAGGGAHSVFAQAFLDVLAHNTGVMEGMRLFQDLAAKVHHEASNLRFNQTPEYAPVQYAGHEGGDFFFVPST